MDICFLIEKKYRIINYFLFITWVSLSLFLISDHKFWFDEVVNLIYGIGADPVYGIHGNGHPAIWFLLLKLSYKITGSYIILPIVAFIISILSMWIFIFKSPFDYKFKAFFVFSGFALYEYVVMARNYGISMLLMFILAMVFSNDKLRNKYTGVLLLLIANTNIHSAILCMIFVFGWIINSFFEEKTLSIKPIIFNSIIMIIGVLICLLTVYPPFVKSASNISEKHRSFSNIRKVINVSTQFYDMAHEPIFGVIDNYLYPDNKFNALNYIKSDHFINSKDEEIIKKISNEHKGKKVILLKDISKIFFSILIYAIPLCLISSRGWLIAAYASLLSFSTFFQFIYPGGYRHQALWLVFVVMLLWIEKSSPQKENTKKKNIIMKIGMIFLYIFLIFQDINGIIFCYAEKYGNYKSPAADFSDFFLKHPEWDNAIILDSPDYLHVPMFYYIKNKTFLISQNRYGIIAPYSPVGNHNYDLDYVINVAEKINYCNNVPVIMIFENDIYGKKAFQDVYEKKYFLLNRIYYFTADVSQISRLNNEAKEVAYFKNGSLESGYTVYVMSKSNMFLEQKECKIYKIP